MEGSVCRSGVYLGAYLWCEMDIAPCFFIFKFDSLGFITNLEAVIPFLFNLVWRVSIICNYLSVIQLRYENNDKEIGFFYVYLLSAVERYQ